MCSCETTSSSPATITDDADTYQVAGMTCGSCAAKVQNAVQGIDGVTEVSVDITTGRLAVAGSATPALVVAAVTDAGYQINPAN